MSRSSGDSKRRFTCGFCGRNVGGWGNFQSHEGKHARDGDEPIRGLAGDRYGELVRLVAYYRDGE